MCFPNYLEQVDNMYDQLLHYKIPKGMSIISANFQSYTNCWQNTFQYYESCHLFYRICRPFSQISSLIVECKLK